ncbi:MAG: 1,4-alpha-glucan branching enzyme GlgB [candidate division WS6 bacterium OLB20]|uniref:1,4-alpha-glucan branching enzyme GlgB n=1 Tax=candidate division WS6 bacterium OLB20 TaxID=1617426 RepID=A0A136LYZ1_9BACT|nr:MAG: 1,4-alpha-glucan branching enzyme GlgB [candidate division WS6 bacterium OLB20]
MYQWQKQLTAKAVKPIGKFTPSTGPRIDRRTKDGRVDQITFTIYAAQKYARIKLIGPFNDWGRAQGDWLLAQDEDSGFYSITVKKGVIQHKTPYLYLVNGQHLRDPAARYFDRDGNAVFWDFGDPRAYQMKYDKPLAPGSSVRIMQTDLPGMIMHYRGKDGRLGWQVEPDQYYSFIRTSGVIRKIRDLGFNAVQFLPVAQSIDGSKWSLRYLVPFLYSVNSYWGSPDEFARMVDAFHKEGIAVILDLVISHAPFKKFNLFGKPSEDVGIHLWKRAGNDDVFLGEETSWGTKRYRIEDEHVRRFVVESALSFIQQYRVDGFRIDNVDGIVRYGDNGDGAERPHGREYIRELTGTVYDYAPDTLFHFEAHYFYRNNAKWLVQALDEHKKALGATAYTSSRLTYHFHAEYMPYSGDKISPWTYKHIIDEKEWGESNSTVADFHNHDAAAGLMPMRATGSYAYDALILKNPELHTHAIGKIKAMEALISFVCEGRTLDLLQTFLLQTESFEHDSSIHWYRDATDAVQGMLAFKSAVNSLLDDPAFWPVSIGERRVINVDEVTKTLTVVRSTQKDSGRHGYLVIIHLTSSMLTDLIVPAPVSGEYEVVFDSDRFTYSGTGRTALPAAISSEKTSLFELFPEGVRLPSVGPYHVLVLKF